MQMSVLVFVTFFFNRSVIYYIHFSSLCFFHLIVYLGNYSNSVHGEFPYSLFYSCMASYCTGAIRDFCMMDIVVIPLTADPISTHELQNPVPSISHLNPFFTGLCCLQACQVSCVPKENLPFILRSLKSPITFKPLGRGVHSFRPQLPFHPPFPPYAL